MRTKIASIDGPEIHIDLSNVVLIELHGQKSSQAGWVSVRMSMLNGRNVESKMSPADYDLLIEKWITPQ